jgi:hypothetical protein
LVFRLIAPFTHHERKLDRALFEALRELRADFERAERTERTERAERAERTERTERTEGDERSAVRPDGRGDPGDG